MSIKNYFITLVLLLFCVSVAHSQEGNMGINTDCHIVRDFVSADTLNNVIRINKRYANIEVHFKLDKYNLDLDYMGNDVSLRNFAYKIDSIGISKIDSVVVVSQSSPEGVYEHNLMLSRNRANTMRKYIVGKHPELNDRLHVYPDGESWLRLRELVKKDTSMRKTDIDKVISVIEADINVGTKKWRMERLPVYRYLLRTYYPRIRNSTFCIVYYSEIIPKKGIPVHDIDIKVNDIDPSSIIVMNPFLPTIDVWCPRLYLKTNVAALGMAISNVAAEIDLAKHWSFSLPVYYSAWDYFKSTIKFRTLAIQPELRYWFLKNNDGFFAGAHFGLAYYNFAFDGAYRYQDYNRETPAIGGGLNFGYRVPISKDKRWRVGASIGAGVYSNYYDTFYNTPRTKDGQLIESIKKVYWGVDQVTISFSYSFDLKR
jgi:hypothetical protein